MDKFTAAAGIAQEILFKTFVNPQAIAAYNMVKRADDRELALFEDDFLRLSVAGEIAAAAISSACLLIADEPAEMDGVVPNDSIDKSIATFSSVPSLDELQLKYESNDFQDDTWAAIDFFRLKDNQAGDVNYMFQRLHPIFLQMWKVETGNDAVKPGMFWLAGISAFHRLVEAEARRRTESNSTAPWTLDNQNLVGSSELLPMLCAALSAIIQVYSYDPPRSLQSKFWPLVRGAGKPAKKAGRHFTSAVREVLVD